MTFPDAVPALSPPPHPVSPGWYADPWDPTAWRWWDGQMWTAYTGGTKEAKPRLPMWLSWPVLLCAIPMVLISGIYLIEAPLAVVLGFVPLVIVLPALWWLDRVEPEPRHSLIHSLLWGAFVATFISSLANGLVAGTLGETAAVVFSAPIVEEATKAIGVLYAIRRRELDGAMDGIVYAGWVAVGFAVVEDFQYFVSADAEGALLPIFIVRGLVTPFAHPLFTFWFGLAVGRAAERGTSIWRAAAWGYPLSVATHMAWNGSLTLSDALGTLTFLVVAALSFLALFAGVAVMLVRARRNEQKAFTDLAPVLVHRYGMSAVELEVFGDWPHMLAMRRGLAKNERKHFDRVHAAFARLAVLHSQPGDADPADEARLVDLLQAARSAPL